MIFHSKALTVILVLLALACLAVVSAALPLVGVPWYVATVAVGAYGFGRLAR